jgi:soluble lytic murein transglycosylase-like protein
MVLGWARRGGQASAMALGAALAFTPVPLGGHAVPERRPPPPEPRPLDPVAARILDRLPSLEVEGARRLGEAVREEAEDAGLDPVLVLAVIGVESAWEPGAVSGRGARGLMQLRSLTIAGEERDAGLAPGDPHDPFHNVRMGIRYLGRMVDVFGDEDLALVAYNAGPTRLASYLQAVGEVPDSLWAYARKVRREERKLRRELERPGVLVADAAR